MIATPTRLFGVLRIEPIVFGDGRGFFYESFNQQRFNTITGLDCHFVQDNHSRSQRHVLRGLHYQIAPRAQGKLVRVVHGEVFDVVVDIRPESPTFGQWESHVLSAENRQQLWIPPGLAHGFLTLSRSAEVLYKTTEYWSAEHERAIRWDDPTLAIAWPLSETPIVSAKDEVATYFSDLHACARIG